MEVNSMAMLTTEADPTDTLMRRSNRVGLSNWVQGRLCYYGIAVNNENLERQVFLDILIFTVLYFTY